MFQNGQYVAWGESGTADTETINPGSNTSAVSSPSSYSAGTYVIDISDRRMEASNIPAEYPERVCFDFTVF